MASGTSGEPERLTVDSLTGLGLREQLERRGAALLSDARRDGHEPLLIIVDLDSFKHLNDSAGHAVGDRVLLETARRLRDVLHPDDLLVRLGGDEFAVLTAASTGSPAAPSDLAERVLGCFDEPFDVDELRLAVQASAGVAAFPADGASVHELLLTADQAMYQVKEAGTVRWLAGHQQGRSAGWNEALTEELRDSSAAEQLEVSYQPQVDLGTGRIAGFDAVVSWRHPVHGLLPARAFVPVAARAGLLAPLTAAALAEALDAAPHLHGFAPGSPLSISVTRRHLLGIDLADQVATALRERGLGAGDLRLKISEPLTRSRSTPQPVFAQLAEHGIGVTIRGYGRAWSSLSALWQNPAVREVKIAPDLVRSLAVDPRSARLIRALASGATELGLRVAAEGVEDPQTALALGDLGCQVAQGPGISPPLLLDEVSGWCARRTQGLLNQPA